VLTFSYLAEHGHGVTILQWIGFATPISLVLVVMSVVVLDILFPIPTIVFNSLRDEILESRKQLGEIKRSELLVAAAFALLIALWLLPGFLAPILEGFPALAATVGRLTPAIAALLVVIPLFMLNASASNDEKLLLASDLSAVDLSVILLFGGGLALGAIIESAGVAVMLSAGLSHVALSHPAFVGFFIAALTLLISEFCSNTGAVALVLPIAFSVANFSGADDTTLRLAFLTVCAGTLGFSMPAGTPPNAIVYATGKVTVRDIAWSGVWVDVFGVLLVTLLLEWVYPWFRIF
jgi:sodium-dependent dicarboxylate transporter 2/3/5